jgi:transmembrane sensor
MDPQHSPQVLQDAARWYARLRAPACSTAERRAFHSWLSVDPAHATAYERAMATDLKMRAALREAAPWKVMADAALTPPARSGYRMPQWLSRPVMAGAFAVLVAILAGRGLHERSATVAEERFVNEGLVHRDVRLADGSVLRLDVGAVVSVRMLPDARRLRLESGRAYFEVAHDSSRPFTVEAAGTRTTALGTEFEVAVHETQALVTLAEGSVAVVAEGGKAAWSQRLVPGQQLVSRRDALTPEVQVVNVAEVTGWSTGVLRFTATALRDVVREWNRYARVRITLGDADLGETEVGGSFRAGGDSGEFVAALSAVLPVRAVPAGAGEILLVREYSEYPL